VAGRYMYGVYSCTRTPGGSSGGARPPPGRERAAHGPRTRSEAGA
jgi:hypothetical protein